MKSTLVMTVFALASSFAQAETLKCTSESGAVSLIEENAPTAGAPTVTSNGEVSVVTFKQTTVVKPFGCYDRITTSKVFFHPYYQYTLEGSLTVGKDKTRCANSVMDGGTSYHGFLVGEMQASQKVECSVIE